MMRLVAGDAVRLVGAGGALGIAGALATTRLLESWLYGVEARDASTIAGVFAVLALTAAVACIHPARRAMSVDPVTALKHR
jgi:putative ABC transport system permease protein